MLSKIRNKYSIIICVFVFMLIPINVRADVGPKPSIHIAFDGLGEELCYGTLLSQNDSTGPSSAWDGTEEHAWTYYSPKSFKILLYFPEQGVFVTSGIYERYAFDSYYTVDMSERAPNGNTVVLEEQVMEETLEAGMDMRQHLPLQQWNHASVGSLI